MSCSCSIYLSYAACAEIVDASRNTMRCAASLEFRRKCLALIHTRKEQCYSL